MRRQFTLQLHAGGNRHKHTCEVCSRQWPCGDTECPGPDTMDTCDDCMTQFDCPQCGEDTAPAVQWECDTQHERGLITQFSAKCAHCGTVIRYQDNDDGRGALMVQWLVYGDPFAGIQYASFNGAPLPVAKLRAQRGLGPLTTRATGKVKGTVEEVVTVQQGGKTHVYKADEVELSIGGVQIDVGSIGIQELEDDE